MKGTEFYDTKLYEQLNRYIWLPNEIDTLQYYVSIWVLIVGHLKVYEIPRQRQTMFYNFTRQSFTYLQFKPTKKDPYDT